jgi:hypothetical protein
VNGPLGTAPCHLPAIGPDTPARRLAGHCPECQHSSTGNTVRHQHHAPTFAGFATGAVKPVRGTGTPRSRRDLYSLMALFEH